MDEINKLKIEIQFLNDRCCLMEQHLEEIDVNNCQELTKLKELLHEINKKNK